MQDLILLHGALGSKNDLHALSSQLKNNFRIYTFSFSGHGGEAFQPGFGIDQFTNELDAFIVNEKLDRPNVFGYSMGGFVALNLLKRNDRALNKLITLGTKFNWSPETVEKETKMLDYELLKQKAPAFASALSQKHGNSLNELLLRTSSMMKAIGPANYFPEEVLQQIKNKILIGLADKDRMVTLDETQKVFKSLPNAGMYMLPNTAHPLETADSEILANLISVFLNKD